MTHYALGPPATFELAVLHRSIHSPLSSPESVLPQFDWGSSSSQRSVSIPLCSPDISPTGSFEDSWEHEVELKDFDHEEENAAGDAGLSDIEENDAEWLPDSSSLTRHKAERTYEGVTPFISRLIVLLKHPELYGKAIHWDESGTAVCFYPEEPSFCSNILPVFFSHSNLSSFRRQLNVYTFRRPVKYRSSKDAPGGVAVYAHPLFTRLNEDDSYPRIQPTVSKARRLQNEKRKQSS